MNREQELIKVLQKNECVLQIVEWDDLVKEWDISKDKTKMAAGYVSPTTDAATALKLIRDIGGVQVDQVRFSTVNGKKYVIFKGYPGKRNILTGTRYLTKSPKVVRMAVGPEGIKASAKGGFVLSVILSVGIEIYSHIFSNDPQAISTLLGTITSDVLKIGLSSIAAWSVAVVAGNVAIIAGMAAGPFIIAIAVGIATSLLLEKIDGRMGVTRALINAYERAGANLKEIEGDISRSIWKMERSIICYYAPVVCGGY